jgi:hypothetical protein
VRRLFRRLVRIDQREDRQRTVYDDVARTRFRVAPMNLLAQLLSETERATVVRIVMQVASGDESGLSALNAEEADRERDIVSKAFRTRQAQNDILFGVRLSLGPLLPNALRALAAAPPLPPQSELLGGEHFLALIAAREAVKSSLGIARALYAATSWIYGRSAFGLRLAAWFAENDRSAFQATMALLWLQLTRNHTDVLTLSEIRAIQERAEHAATASRKLRELACEPRFANVLTPKKLRAAFQEDTEFELFLREIADVRGKSSI